MTGEMFESVWVNIGFFLHHPDPKLRRIVKRRERLHLEIIKKTQSMVFNRTCLDNILLHIYIYIYIIIVERMKKHIKKHEDKYIQYLQKLQMTLTII